MAQRYYLVRRGLESFLGPMTASELKTSYKKMEFGLQDEIASGFRDWVTFDDFEKLKRNYPELVDLVKNDMLSGWGVETAQVAKPKQKRPLLLSAILISIALVVFLIARFTDLSSRFNLAKDPSSDRALQLISQGKWLKFDSYMDQYRKEIVASLGHKKTLMGWLPVIRADAFRHDWKFDGISDVMLRGATSAAMPKDCSLAAWQARWKKTESSWAGFIRGDELTKADWAKLLTWDPLWLRRRAPAEGWAVPRSYGEVCLAMAEASLQKLPLELTSSADDRDLLLARLRWQLRILRGETVGSDIILNGGLWALSCYESTASLDSLEECHEKFRLGSEWQSLLEFRHAETQLRLAAESQTVDPEFLKTNLVTQKVRDPFNGLSFEAEVKYLQLAASNPSKTKAAFQEARRDFPELVSPY